MLTVRHASERGQANFGWLQSRHSFSFGEYYDKDQMGFSALRVINEDKVSPGAGFATHSHRDMEILSYVLRGSIAHKDSENNTEVLPAGGFQLMSAGSGISHSEYNASKADDLHFLQIWIQPNVYGGEPGYQQKPFAQKPGLTLVLSPNGEAGSLHVKQDARVYRLQLGANDKFALQSLPERNYYIHTVSGQMQCGSHTLGSGDGLKVEGETGLAINTNDSPVEALVFDLP